MAKYNNNYQPKSAEQKAQEADKFYNDIKDKAWGDSNLGRYPIPMAMLVDSYKEKLCSSILKKHKALSKRDISFLMNSPRFKNPFYNHMENVFGLESKITYKQAVLMQRDAWLGKYDTKFIKSFLDSCNADLAERDKAKAKKA
jgi:hypothetical protein